MAMPNVSFQLIPRQWVSDDEKCSLCFETKDKESREWWWAHPLQNSNQLIHYIHGTCLKRLALMYNDCPLCLTPFDRNQLPVLSPREENLRFQYGFASKLAWIAALPIRLYSCIPISIGYYIGSCLITTQALENGEITELLLGGVAIAVGTVASCAFFAYADRFETSEKDSIETEALNSFGENQ